MTINKMTVGIDSSELAETALTWTIAAAAQNNASVDAVATWEMPLIAKLPKRIQGLPTPEFMTTQASKALAETIDRVTRKTAHAVSVKQRIIEGKPGPALVNEAASSDLLVVGRTGYGKRHGLARFAELTLGSTAKHCVNNSPTPIATIPSGATWTSAPSVVVGVDGSPGSLAALDWALTELPATSTVNVIRAFEPWIGDGLVPQDLIGEEQLQRDVQDETQAWIDSRIGQLKSPHPTVALQVVIATAQHAILNPGYRTDLIVVGKQSRNPITAMVLGSVSDYAVRYAQCPVVVVPK